jgi:hypothetical protein
MFVVAAAALMLPACTRHVLQMSSPERASTVTFFDRGDGKADGDDRIVVLDQPAEIARVAGYFRKRAAKWQPYTGKIDHTRRYQISFRKGEDVTDRFWIVDDSLFLHSPSGKYYVCKLSDAEREELLNLFSESQPAADPVPAASGRGAARVSDAPAMRLTDDEEARG